MLNLNVFNKDNIPGVKLAAHVIFVNQEGVAEVVDSFIPSNINDGFEALKWRVDGYTQNADLTLADFDCFNVVDPGCNSAIFKVIFKDCSYQLNFVEIY